MSLLVLSDCEYKIVRGTITTIIIYNMPKVYTEIDFAFDVKGEKTTLRSYDKGPVFEMDADDEGDVIGRRYHFGYNKRDLSMIILDKTKEVYPLKRQQEVYPYNYDLIGFLYKKGGSLYYNGNKVLLEEVAMMLYNKDYNKIKKELYV